MRKQDGTADDRHHAEAARREAVDWFVRLRADDAGAGEREAFEAWRDADPTHAEAYRAISALWDAPALDRALRAADPQPRVRPAEGGAVAVRHRTPWGRLAIAATLLLAVLGAALQADLPLRLAADHLTATGEQRRIVLADGTRLLLDTGSAVIVDLAEKERRVRLLRGRAYFEVATDQGRPFVVAAGSARVRVTGTAFAVGLHDGGTRIAVRHGAVEVAGNGTAGGGAPVHLGPGDAARVAGTAAVLRRHADAAAFAWTEGRLVFENRPLGEIVDELRRYHAGVLLLTGDRLPQVRLTGSYRLDDPANTAVRLAELAGGRVLRLTDRVLVLR